MGEFRIGRKHAHHSYPDTPRGAGALSFARNFAMGPSTPTAVPTSGVQVPWDFLEAGTAPTPNVPITPHVTGRMLFSGDVVVTNGSGGPVTVSVQVQVDGSTLLVPLVQETVDAGGEASLGFEILSLALFAIGVTKNIQVLVSASVPDAITLNTDSSTIEIEEKQFATG